MNPAYAVALAAEHPDVVVAHSVDWLDAAEAAGAEVLARLPTHWHRMAVAGALRAWPAEAVEVTRLVAERLEWDPRDTEALLRVMLDEAPELVHPEGLEDSRRWWIVGGAPWDWTLWRADDGTHALEVLRSGWSSTSQSEVLDADRVQAWRAEGAAALVDLVQRLRDF
jgi:hypothetical protein